MIYIFQYYHQTHQREKTPSSNQTLPMAMGIHLKRHVSIHTHTHRYIYTILNSIKYSIQYTIYTYYTNGKIHQYMGEFPRTVWLPMVKQLKNHVTMTAVLIASCNIWNSLSVLVCGWGSHPNNWYECVHHFGPISKSNIIKSSQPLYKTNNITAMSAGVITVFDTSEMKKEKPSKTY